MWTISTIYVWNYFRPKFLSSSPFKNVTATESTYLKSFFPTTGANLWSRFIFNLQFFCFRRDQKTNLNKLGGMVQVGAPLKTQKLKSLPNKLKDSLF